MAKSTLNETERMVASRVFDAPRKLGWRAWTAPLAVDLARLDPTSVQEAL